MSLPSLPYFSLLRFFRFLLLMMLCLSMPAQAAVTAGTITFGEGNSAWATITTQYYGLDLSSGWMYYTSADMTGYVNNASGDAATGVDGTSAGPGYIKSADGSEFSVTSVRIWDYGGNTKITFAGYRDGASTTSVEVNLSGKDTNNFVTKTIGLENVDEVRVFGDVDGTYAIDDLIVTSYTAPLTLSPASLNNPTVGSAFSQTISASGGNGSYSYSVTAGALPAGLSLNSSTGVLSGTPTAGGSFSFTIKATDTASLSGSKAYSVTVAAPTLSFSPATLTAGTVGSAYSQSISGNGGTAPYGSYIVKTGALPAGLSLSSSGVVSGTPTAGGTFTFTVQGTDSSTGSGPYSATSSTISLTIAAPTLSFTPATLTGGTVGAAYSQPISGSGGTAPYGSFALASGSLPPGLSLAAGGTLSGTPTAAGTYTFTVSAQDSSTGSGPYTGTSSTISLTIGAPTLSLSPASVPAAARGSAFSQTFSTSGGTSPYSYSITAGSLPAGLTLSSGGVLSGTPTADGSFSFTVTATDSSGGTQYSTSQAYSLTVNPPLAVANAVSATVAFNSSNNTITLNITGGTAASVAVASGPSHGTATASGTSITYTPTTGYSGSDSFTYTATNASGTSAAATVSVTVNPAVPVANAVSATVAQDSSNNAITLNISGGAAASVAVASGASHGTATASGTSISYTPTAGYTGADSFTYTATNVTGTSTAATVTITVSAAPPVANAVSATVAFDSSNNAITPNVTGGAATSVAVASPPSHGTATASGTGITYTPTAGYAGSDSFTYTATNGVGTSASATVTITVSSPTLAMSPASGALPAGTATAIYSRPFAASGGTAPYSYALTAGSLPAGLSLNTSTGILSGTPTTAVSSSFTVTATDSSSSPGPYTVSGSYTLTVNPLPVGTLTFATATAISLSMGHTLSNSAISTLSGGSYGAISYSSSDTTVATVNASTGVVTPVSVGTTTITAVQAAVPGVNGEATQTYTLTVIALPVGTLSFSTPGSASVTMGSSLTNTATSTLSGGSFGAITYSSSSTGVATVNASGVVTPVSVGTTTITATQAATVANASASQTYTLTVNPAPAVPVANAVSATVAYGSSGNVITPTLGGGSATSLAVVSNPTHGTVGISGLTLVYTPVSTYTGSDSFTYRATNAGGTSAAATVSITVNPAAPVAGAVTLKIPVNSSNNPVPLSITGGAASTVAVATAASHGTATASGASITYTPVAGFSGTDSFTYTATNATGTSAAATVTLLVQTRPDPTKDAEVTGLINAQAESANRFAQAQIGNFQTHLESLHQRSRRGGFGLSASTKRNGRNTGTDGSANTTSATSATSATGTTGATGSTTGDAAGTFGTGTSASSSSSDTGLVGVGSRTTRSAAAATRQTGTLASMYGQSGNASFGSGLDTFVLPQKNNATSSNSLDPTTILPWSLSSLSLAGKHGDVLGNGLEIWTGGVVSVGKQNDTDTRFTTSGISLGGDRRVSDELTVGIGAGFGHEHQKIGDNGTRNLGDSYSVVAYGSYQPGEGIFFDGLIGYSTLDFDARRYVSALDTKADASRTGTQWFSSLSGGYDTLYDKMLLSTYSRLDLVSSRLKRTTETGGGIYNLTYFEQTITTTKLSFGVRGETEIELSNGVARPYFRVEYQHNFEKPDAADMAYADELYTVYQMDIDGVDRNTLVLGLGGDLMLKKNLGLGLSYRYSQGSESTRIHTLGFQLKKAF